MRPLLAGTNTKGYSQGITFVVTGAILLLALTIDAVARRLQAKPAAESSDNARADD